MREKNESVFLAGWARPLPAGLQGSLNNPSLLAIWEIERFLFGCFGGFFVKYSAEQLIRWPECTNLLPPEKN